MTNLRPGLPPLPDKLKGLAVDRRGYPVPFFVGYVGEEPDFRVVDPRKLLRCVKEKLCWVCGQPLDPIWVFVIGPMCGVNRISSEPPSHYQCARFSAEACPFLARPHMVRREND